MVPEYLGLIIYMVANQSGFNDLDEIDVTSAQGAADTLLLIDAAIVAYPRYGIPAGCASTDSECGVRIEWVRPGASVHLVVPAEESRPPYVYHEVGNDYATEDVTAERLAYWLQSIE